MMNKNLEKVCRFLVENKIVDEELTLDFNEGILMYNDFEWDLNSICTEVEVKKYDEEYEELVVEDCDQYKLKVNSYGDLEVETPDDEGVNSDIKALLDFYNTEEFKSLLEHFKFVQENADLFNRIYIDVPKIGAR